MRQPSAPTEEVDGDTGSAAGSPTTATNDESMKEPDKEEDDDFSGSPTNAANDESMTEPAKEEDGAQQSVEVEPPAAEQQLLDAPAAPADDASVQAPSSAETEIRPLQQQPPPPQEQGSHNVIAHAATTVVLGTIYIVLSSALIDFNKYLMSPGNFPFGTSLVMIHSVTCVLCSSVLYCLNPKLFPALTDPEKKVEINRQMLLTGALPVAVSMCCSLVLSNMAYMWSNVAFLQMMKEANVALVYIMALSTGLEKFSVMHSQVLALLLGATLISVDGEAEFSFTGCMVQALAQLCESTKVTLQSILLSGGSQRKLDPLSYLLVVTPVCCCVLLSGLLVLVFCQYNHLTGPHWAVPGVDDFARNWKLLILNGLLAFCLNLVVAAFLKHTSSVAVILVGIVKDAVIVFFNVMFMNEHITRMQNVGFLFQLVLVGVWSTMKTFPEYFEQGWGNFGMMLMGMAGCTGLSIRYPSKELLLEKS